MLQAEKEPQCARVVYELATIRPEAPYLLRTDESGKQGLLLLRVAHI